MATYIVGHATQAPINDVLKFLFFCFVTLTLGTLPRLQCESIFQPSELSLFGNTATFNFGVHPYSESSTICSPSTNYIGVYYETALPTVKLNDKSETDPT